MRILLLAALALMSACSDRWTAPPADFETTTARVVSERPDVHFIGGVIMDGQVIAEDGTVLGSLPPKSRFRAFFISGYPDSVSSPALQANDRRSGTRTEQRGYCWYLVTYRISTGEIVEEELLWCDTATNPCDETQEEIAREYRTYGVNDRQHPNCEDIELNGQGSVWFSWSELNGYWQEGNPHTGYGWVSETLKYKLDNMRDRWGGPLTLSSGYRCPHGNATLPKASDTSWHLEGRAADISVKTLAGVWSDWDGMTEAERARVKEIWDDLNRIASALRQQDPQPFEEYDDRHFHAAW